MMRSSKTKMLNPEYIGQRLIERGFRTFFLYLFKIIEGREFIVEPIHSDLFVIFENLYKQVIIRSNVNIPPRSAKTTMAKYFIVYCWTINPKCNFIYTSYSQSLLSSISSEIQQILEHPAYKAMYPNNRVTTAEEIAKPLNDFWEDYLYKETGKNLYTSKRIMTYAGGVCLFSSIGAQITGYGAGIRNSKGFSGALIIDDANKPADIRHQVMREKVLTYYSETLLSRLNNSNVAIVNIQQRLHIEDLSGLLQARYQFETLAKPLIDENGVCQIPSQYTKQRLEELQIDNYVFSAQYQQQPIILGGAVIRREWFKYYQTGKDYNYKRILITADTAMKVKEHNDFSVFMVGAITPENKLHILDMVRGKWEAPDLKQIALNTFNKYRIIPKTGVTCSGLYVEDKASGIGLVQELQRAGLPISPLKCDTDKLTRTESILTYIESGQVLLPNDENYGFNPELIKECESFTRDDSHLHDDIVDALDYLIIEGLAKQSVSLLDYFM